MKFSSKRFMKGMAPATGEKGEVVAELHSPFPSHIEREITYVTYNFFPKICRSESFSFIVSFY